MRTLEVLKTLNLKENRGILVWVKIPEDMKGLTQHQAVQEIYQKKVKLSIEGQPEKEYLVRGFEMQGYPDRIVEEALGIMIREKVSPISQCNKNK